MNQRNAHGFYLLLASLAFVLTLVMAKQWQRSMLLREELAAVRLELSARARVLAENERLRAKQIPSAELEALRADHASVIRLRTELEALRRAK